MTDDSYYLKATDLRALLVPPAEHGGVHLSGELDLDRVFGGEEEVKLREERTRKRHLSELSTRPDSGIFYETKGERVATILRDQLHIDGCSIHLQQGKHPKVRIIAAKSMSFSDRISAEKEIQFIESIGDSPAEYEDGNCCILPLEDKYFAELHIQATDSERFIRDAIEETGPSPDPPLKPTERMVFDLVKSQPEDKGITGKEIVEALSKKGTRLNPSTLTKHIIPPLKKLGIKNARGVGYYYPRG